MISEEAARVLREACQACPDGGCALLRLAKHLPRGRSLNLHEHAQILGLTATEAQGVMDGWDTLGFPDSPGIFGELHLGVPSREPEYAAGRKLGCQLAVEFRKPWSP